MRLRPERAWVLPRVARLCGLRGRGMMKAAWRGASPGLGLATTACTPQDGGPGVNLNVGGTGSAEAPCFVEVDGRRIGAEQLATAAHRWRGREVHLRADVQTPYRCMGGVIYELQRAGVERIGFISEPAPESPTER